MMELYTLVRLLDHHKIIMKKLSSQKINNQYNSYTCQSKSNTCFDIQIKNFFLTIFSHNLLLKNTAINKPTIPKTIFNIKAQGLNFSFRVAKGSITATPNQPAERLVKISAIVPIQILSIIPIYHSGQIDPTSLFQSFQLRQDSAGQVEGQVMSGFIFVEYTNSLRDNYAFTATQVKSLYTGGALNFAPVTGAP